MSATSERIETQVAEFLKGAGVDFVAIARGKGKDKQGWEHYAFDVVLSRGKVPPLYTPYRMGTGHATKSNLYPDGKRPPKPTAADVLCALLSDASGAEEIFETWCGEYGYDPDSRSALASYLECQTTVLGLARIFNAEQRATLREMLQDY